MVEKYLIQSTCRCNFLKYNSENAFVMRNGFHIRQRGGGNGGVSFLLWVDQLKPTKLEPRADFPN